jgi:hypothetical protein
MHHFIRQQIRKSRSCAVGLNFAPKSNHGRQQYQHSSTAVRKGFGSFHSEDVEVLIRQDDDVYTPPSIHSEITLKLKEKNDDIVGNFNFGVKAKRGLFILGTTHSFFNCCNSDFN